MRWRWRVCRLEARRPPKSQSSSFLGGVTNLACDCAAGGRSWSAASRLERLTLGQYDGSIVGQAEGRPPEATTVVCPQWGKFGEPWKLCLTSKVNLGQADYFMGLPLRNSRWLFKGDLFPVPLDVLMYVIYLGRYTQLYSSLLNRTSHYSLLATYTDTTI